MSYFADTSESTRLQCRHIFTDGHRCASPSLRNEHFCYYHHTTRKPANATDLKARRQRSKTFALPTPEDRSAIQQSIGEVLQRIASNDIDPRRAGLLLYGLQIAAINLPKPNPKARIPDTVAEVIEDPTYGPLAPEAEIGHDEPKGSAARMLEHLERKFGPSSYEHSNTPKSPLPATLPIVEATEGQPLAEDKLPKPQPALSQQNKSQGRPAQPRSHRHSRAKYSRTMKLAPSILCAAVLLATASTARAIEIKISSQALERTLNKQLFTGPDGKYFIKGSDGQACYVYAQNPKVTFKDDRIVIHVKTKSKLGAGVFGSCVGVGLTTDADVSVIPQAEGESIGFRDARIDKLSASKELSFLLVPFLTRKLPQQMKVNAAELVRQLLSKSAETTGYDLKLDNLKLHSMQVTGDDLVVDFDGDLSVH